MHKLKHGDRVTCEILGKKIDDARISVDTNGKHFICQNKEDGARAENILGYKYSWSFNPEGPEPGSVTNLTAIPRTLDDLMAGDEVENGDGDRQKVLARVENLVALSCLGNHNSFGAFRTIQEMKESSYTLVQPIEESIEELTMEEVCKRLGKQVKIKK